jgi:membrane-bound ClpP family serine protease
MHNKSNWLWIIALIGILIAVIKFLGPLSIPIFGIIMVLAGVVFLKEAKKEHQVFGKIFLFTGITVVLTSIVIVGLLMPWGKTETKTTVVNITPTVQIK